MTGYVPKIILETARILRKNMTEAESILWEKIKGRKLGVKFLRQKPIFLYEEQKGFPRYCIPDFCSLENKVILEVDGSIHAFKAVYLLDREKENVLIQNNFIIIRIKNNEIFDNIDKVIEKIVVSFP